MEYHKRAQRDLPHALCNAPPRAGWDVCWQWSCVTCKDCIGLRNPLRTKEIKVRDEKYIELLERLEEEVRKAKPASAEVRFLLVHIARIREELGQTKTAKARTNEPCSPD